MKKRRILLFLLSAILCLGLLSTGVSAKSLELFVGTTDVHYTSDYFVTGSNGELTTTGASKTNYNVHYDGTTLYLNNFQYKGPGYAFNDPANSKSGNAAIYTNVPVTIKTTGNCQLWLTEAGYNYGIYGQCSYYSTDAVAIKSDEMNYFVLGSEDCSGYYGILTNYNVEINNIFFSMNVDNLKTYGDIGGIECNNLSFKDSVAEINNGRSSNGKEFGVWCYYNTAIKDSQFYVSNGPCINYSSAICAQNISINHSDVTFEATASCDGGICAFSSSYAVSILNSSNVYTSSDGSAYGAGAINAGIDAYGNILIKDSSCEFNTGYAEDEAAGMISHNSLIAIDHSKVRCCAGESDGKSMGIDSTVDISIDNSEVFARSDKAPESAAIKDSMGFDGKTSITNSDVIAYAKNGKPAFSANLNLTYAGGYSVFAGKDYNSAVRTASPSYKEPFVWLTAKKNTVNKFSDVKESSWYGIPVLWAVAHGITSGTGDGTTFSPTEICDRAQMVTFLWNLAGKPEPVSSFADSDFTDIENNKWYTKAVLWAGDRGITAGTSPTTFEPKKQLSRAEVVRFLWNYCRQPEPSVSSTPFKDLTASWYKEAVFWAFDKGITSGKTATLFAPADPCSRAEIVSFIYRCEMVR